MLWKWAQILLHSWYSVGFCWTACLQLFAVHRDGRKRWAERYMGGGDKVVEGRGRWGQAGKRTQMAGRELKGQRRGTCSKSAVVQRTGALPAWPSCREEGSALSEHWLQAPPAPLRWLSSRAPLPGVAFTQLQLMHMQSAATYAADR